MEQIKMKVVSFDEESQSLLVCFASDTTRQGDPLSYPAVAVQPFVMWPDVVDMNEIKKRIAALGITHVNQIVHKESVQYNADKMLKLRALVGDSTTYAIADVMPSSNSTPFHTV